MLFTHLAQWDLSFSYSENISLEVAKFACFLIILILHEVQKYKFYVVEYLNWYSL